MDIEKALSIGLTLDGLKYSLGYTEGYSFVNLGKHDTLMKAKSEFFDFYTSRNLSSLLEFYKIIAVDLDSVYSIAEFRRLPMGVKLTDAKSYFRGVFFVHYQICYVYQLEALYRRFPKPSGAWVKLLSRSNGIDSTEPGLWIHFKTTNLDMLFNPLPPVLVPPFTRNKILVTAARFVSLSKPDARCVDHDEVGHDYCEFLCMAQCQNRHYKLFVGHQLFRSSLVNESLSPWDAWNYLDPPDERFMGSTQTAHIDAECNSECHPPCDKLVYQLTYQWQQPLAYFYSMGKATNDSNATVPHMTYYELLFEHTAKYSGVTTFFEVTTYSFTELATGIGGCLGLFLGATMMTFVQLIWFLVEYVLTRLGYNF